MTLDGDLSGFSMHELFRMEAQEQARVLTDGVLLLERGTADAATLEALMRAAHSVKGAAAIVGMDPAVRLAHAMEDVLVAAQRGALRFDAAGIDVLLDAIDLLRQLADLAPGAAGAGYALAPRLEALVAALGGLLAAAAPAPPVESSSKPASSTAASTTPASSTRAPSTPAPSTPAPAVPTPPSPAPAAPAEPPVAVAAPASDALLTLAGQARLHAGQLRPWIAGMQRYKRQQRSVFQAMEALRDAVVESGDSRLAEMAQLLFARAAPLRDTLQGVIADAEAYERQAANVAACLVDEVLALRMCRIEDGLPGLARMVRDLGRSLGKEVHLAIEGAATPVDRAVLARMEAPLTQLLRNAVDHGMETPAERLAAGKPAHGTVRLAARHRGGMLALDVADDGRGVDPERIRAAAVRRRLAAPAFAPDLSQAELMAFLFLPGFSLKDNVSELSGRGVGLDVVHDTVRQLNGTVHAESQPGLGFRTVITLPLTQSIVRALVVDIGGEAYALPIARVERVLRLPAGAVRTLAGRQFFTLDADDEHIGLVAAGQVLGLGAAAGGAELAVVVIGSGRERHGLVVDAVRGEQSLTVQPLEPAFGKLRDISAAALLDDGAPALILDVPDLLLSVARLLHEGAALQPAQAVAATGAARRILVVDDSLTVREMQRKLLAARGYRVDVALDGIDGWNQLRAGAHDLVITDIDMPRLDGIALVERIRQDPRLFHLPVMIVSYKDRPEDRARGMEAGADHYLAKGAFHDASLLDAVHDLIGPAEAA
jgi:two-component system sensor histidine kinase and response regulator WspE